MSVEEYQKILTQLLTKKSEREAFLLDRFIYLDGVNICPENQQRFLCLDSNQLEESALALVRKRWGVVKNLLQLNDENSENIRPHYFEYALENPIKGKVFKHQLDALYFAESYPFDPEIAEHIKHRVKAIKAYLVAEGCIPEKKKFWKTIWKTKR